MVKIFMLLLPLLLTGCHLAENHYQKAIDNAHDWAEAYFNNDFHEAERLSTPESGRWLRFAASNTTQEELDALPRGGATVVVKEFNQANDTLGVATIEVSNYVRPTAIGSKPEVADKGLFLIPMVKRNGKWLVRMEGLPRSERQSRD